MATIEGSFYTKLAADDTVGGYVGTRIYQGQAPQNPTMPYIVYNRASGIPLFSSTQPLPTFHTIWQVDNIAGAINTVRALADGTREEMNGWTNESSPEVGRCFLTNEINDFDSPADGSEIGIFRIIQTYSIWHS